VDLIHQLIWQLYPLRKQHQSQNAKKKRHYVGASRTRQLKPQYQRDEEDSEAITVPSSKTVVSMASTGTRFSSSTIFRSCCIRTKPSLGTCMLTLMVILLMGASVQFNADFSFANKLSVSSFDANSNGAPSALSLLSSTYSEHGFSSTAPLDNIKLSNSLKYLADVDDLPLHQNDIPFFFHVPRSGGSTMKDIMGSCFGMVMASDVGARDGHKYDKTLQVIEDSEGSKFVNVDTTTAVGIHRAKSLNLVESGLADVIVTQHLHPAATMFNENQRGRMFTMMRNPIERAVSLFHYLGVADWEPTYDPDLAYISIEMYARSKRIEHNWMVRFLSNELERDLTEKHLDVAKEVLRKKCLVGILDEKAESFMRFEKYFGWPLPSEEAKSCHENFIENASNKHDHPLIEEGSAAWELLSVKNDLDMKLYEYGKELFREQARLFMNKNQQPQNAAPAPNQQTAQIGAASDEQNNAPMV